MLKEVLRLLSNLENPCVSFPFPKSPINLHASFILNSQLDRFELKSGMIHLLPTYYGNTTEDPYMHIKQFFEIFCSELQSLELCNTPSTPFQNELRTNLNCPISWANRYRIESKTWGTS
ncbi:unnamed protein product [Prunus brigantina]